MSFNALDIYLQEKQRFITVRGVGGSSSIGKAIPNTTWKDVYKFGTVFLAKCSNHEFVETSSYKKARNAFANEQPLVRAIRAWGALGFFHMAAKSEMNEVYPWNKEFWEAANRFAIARNAAGMVQDNWSMAIDSILESAAELPKNVAGGLNFAADTLGIKAFLRKVAIYGAVGLGVYLIGLPILRNYMEKRK